jgi:hypothetical protein
MSKIASTVVNALIRKADVNPAYKPIVSLMPQFSWMVGACKFVMGGLWVGGDADLFEDKLCFRPNKMNRFLHGSSIDNEIVIQLSEIKDIRVRPGLVTMIIDIATIDGTVLSIRCWDAQEFAQEIRNAVSQKLA